MLQCIIYCSMYIITYYVVVEYVIIVIIHLISLHLVIWLQGLPFQRIVLAITTIDAQQTADNGCIAVVVGQLQVSVTLVLLWPLSSMFQKFTQIQLFVELYYSDILVDLLYYYNHYDILYYESMIYYALL